MAARYRFHTTWLLDAPRERVAGSVLDFERWAAWWPGLEAVEALGGGRYRQRWRSPLGYAVAFVATVERASEEEVEGTVDGALAGGGRCTLAGAPGGGTRVAFSFGVETRARWMRALAPLARPAFAWAHRALMRRGGEGLARELGVRLVAVTHAQRLA